MRNLAVIFMLLFCKSFQPLWAQDFLLRGCGVACQDSLESSNWMKKTRAQVPDLSLHGFTYFAFPAAVLDTQNTAFTDLLKTLRKNGIEPMIDVTIPKGEGLLQLMSLSEQLRNRWQIKSFRIRSEGEPKPVVVAHFLKEYQLKTSNQSLIFADIIERQKPAKLADWISSVVENLPPEARIDIQPRVYDYPLREALRRACTDATYDVRQLYKSSIRDATSLSGYNIVTGINNEHFLNANSTTNDKDDWLENPLLAYAYLLTNNQLGLPEVFYADYFGKESGYKLYGKQPPLKNEIDQLLKVHQSFIYNSTEVEYLNRLDTDKKSVYQNAAEGADATRALVFQLDGTQTPAGKANNGHRDVIVAINFADKPLKLVQEINTFNIRPGDIFTDVLGRSAEAVTKVETKIEPLISNAIYIELPPRSYSIWVQGEAPAVASGITTLAVQIFEDFVELTWESAAETAIKSYEIEKSVNGSPFQKIATIEALNESGAEYLYTDESRLPDDAVAYRIKTLQKIGEPIYSSVQSIEPVLKETSFELLEGEKSSLKTIKIRSSQLESSQIEVFSAEGKPVLKFTHPIKKGISLAQLDLSDLPKGVYIVNVNAKSKTWTKKIVNW